MPLMRRNSPSPHSSQPCTSTSVSVREENRWPDASSSRRRSRKLKISPLNTTQTSSCSSAMGWKPASLRSMIASLAKASSVRPRLGGSSADRVTLASSPSKVTTPAPSGPRCRIVSSIAHPSLELTVGPCPMTTASPHIRAPALRQGGKEWPLGPRPDRMQQAANPLNAPRRAPSRCANGLPHPSTS